MERVSVFITKTIEYVFLVLAAIILIASVFSFSEVITGSWIKYIIAIMLLCGIGVFFVMGNTLHQKVHVLLSHINSLSIKQMFIILFLFVLISKVAFVFLLDNNANLHPDMQMYLSFASQLADQGVVKDYFVYALRFPYTMIYGMFLSPLVRLFGDDTKVLTSFLSVLFAITSVLLFDIIREYVGKNKAFLGLIAFNLLPVGLFETQLLVHETALLFFYILSFWLFYRAIHNQLKLYLKVLLILMSALLIVFGAQINKGGEVVIISYVIIAVIVVFRSKSVWWKQIGKVLCITLSFALCLMVVSNLCTAFVDSHVICTNEEKEQIDSAVNNSLPFGWGAYLGLNIEKPGQWNEEDRNTYEKYMEIEDAKEARNYQIDLIRERAEVFLKKPWLIPGHLFKKLKNLWGGVFLPFGYDQGNALNDFVLRGIHGIINKALIVIAYLTFILMCSVIVFSFKRRITEADAIPLPELQFKMMIIGLTLALLPFEVTPKYVSHMQIIMFAIGIFSIDGFMDNSRRIHDRLFHKKDAKA